jgi:membrane protein insertase Oxa1/YidC/SpoIIIJ
LQLPILWALFRIFKSSIELDKLGDILYPFISVPSTINYNFLGVNLAEASIGIALITAVAQYFQAKTMQVPKKQEGKEKDQMEQISEIMQKQMMLVIPVFTFFILFKLPAALGLYWFLITVLNVFQQRKIYNK